MPRFWYYSLVVLYSNYLFWTIYLVYCRDSQTVGLEILGSQKKLAFCAFEIGFFTIIFIYNQKLEKVKCYSMVNIG